MIRLYVIVLASLCSAVPVFADAPHSRGVKGTVEIDASVGVVWDTVHIERLSDPDLVYSRVLEQNGNKVLLEQKFGAMPLIGEAVCVLAQEESLHKRIDYKLVKSNKFKEMSGSWVFTELADGRTELSLSSSLRTGIPCSRHLLNLLLKDKIQKRLERIKDAAESRPVADSGKNDGE